MEPGIMYAPCPASNRPTEKRLIAATDNVKIVRLILDSPA
jgi:hypothetical protein